MPGGLGMLGYVALARESSGGVAVSPTHYIEALSEGLKLDLDRYELMNIAGQITEPDDEAGVRRIGGDIVAPFDPLVGGMFLRGAIGSATVTSLGGGYWLHSFKPPVQSEWDSRYALQPLTFEVFRDVGSAQAYAGCNINRLELSIAPNQPLQMTAGIIGTSMVNRAASTASYSGLDSFQFDASSVALDGVANADIESMTFVLDNALEGVPTLNGADTIRKIRRTGFISTRFNFMLGFESINELNAFMNQTEKSFAFSVRQGSAALSLRFPRLVYDAFPTGIGGRGRQTVEVTSRLRHHVGSGTSFEIQLTSPVGSY